MGRDLYADAVVVITGAGSGLGRAMAMELALRSAVVFVTDVDEAAADATAEEIRNAGGRADAMVCDVTIESDLTAVMLRVVQDHGRIDIMINNAGILLAGEAHHNSAEEARRLFEIDYWGVYNGTMAAYEVMRRQRSGTIVNIASMAGLMPFPHATSYTAAKHAVVGFSTSLEIEAASCGVRVSTVCPGFVRTNLFGRRNQDGSAPLRRGRLLRAMDVDRAARSIIAGVGKGKRIIVVPFYPRLVGALRSFSPRIYDFLARRTIQFIQKRSRTAS